MATRILNETDRVELEQNIAEVAEDVAEKLGNNFNNIPYGDSNIGDGNINNTSFGQDQILWIDWSSTVPEDTPEHDNITPDNGVKKTNVSTLRNLLLQLYDSGEYFTADNDGKKNVENALQEIGAKLNSELLQNNAKIYETQGYITFDMLFEKAIHNYTDDYRNIIKVGIGELVDNTSNTTLPAGNYLCFGALDDYRIGCWSCTDNTLYSIEKSWDDSGNAYYTVTSNKITVDTALSANSTNPVQSRVINTALNNKMNGIGSFATVTTETFPDDVQVLGYSQKSTNTHIKFDIETLENNLIETGTFGGSDSLAWWQSDSKYTISGTYQTFGDYCTITARASLIPGWQEVSYNLPFIDVSLGRSATLSCNGDDIENQTGGDEVVFIVSTGTNTSSSGYSKATVHIKRQDGGNLDDRTVTFTLTYKYKGTSV